MDHLNKHIYLDNAATTFPKPLKVIDAINECMLNGCVNAGRAVYELAQKGDQLIAETRLKVSNLLGFNYGEIIFAPSATIALNQIIFGLNWKKGDVVYTTPLEHNSVIRPLTQLANIIGIKILQLPLDPFTYQYNMNEIERMFFNNPPTAVIMSHVSNVSGNVTPIEEIAIKAKIYDCKVIVDGAQAGPLLPVNNSKHIDFYVFSGHKTFYGPFGIAGFWYSKKHELKPYLFGGTGSHSESLSMPEQLPYKYEVGSHNIVAISGLNAACDWIKEIGYLKILEHEQALMDIVIDSFSDVEEIKLLLSKDKANQTGILSLTVDGYTPQEIATILDQEFNISVRAGLHCAPMAHSFFNTYPKGTVRVSLSYFNTIQDIKTLTYAIKKIVDVF